jgi:hypothetical protein
MGSLGEEYKVIMVWGYYRMSYGNEIRTPLVTFKAKSKSWKQKLRLYKVHKKLGNCLAGGVTQGQEIVILGERSKRVSFEVRFSQGFWLCYMGLFGWGVWVWWSMERLDPSISFYS